MSWLPDAASRGVDGVKHGPVRVSAANLGGDGPGCRRAIAELACPVIPPAMCPPVLPDAATMRGGGIDKDPVCIPAADFGGGVPVSCRAIAELTYPVRSPAIDSPIAP